MRARLDLALEAAAAAARRRAFERKGVQVERGETTIGSAVCHGACLQLGRGHLIMKVRFLASWEPA